MTQVPRTLLLMTMPSFGMALAMSILETLAMEALLAINLISPQLMVVVLIAAAAVAVVAVALAAAAEDLAEVAASQALVDLVDPGALVALALAEREVLHRHHHPEKTPRRAPRAPPPRAPRRRPFCSRPPGSRRPPATPHAMQRLPSRQEPCGRAIPHHHHLQVA